MSPLESGQALCEALGLDPNRVQTIVLRWHVGDFPRARVTLIDFDGAEVVRTVARYRLEPIAKSNPDRRTLADSVVDGVRAARELGVPLT
jgi:hypothetical protein